MHKIGVLDCNNFFVSCERVFRPDLKNKPVVVLSGNDGCVVARSQEIKDIGIPIGVPYFQIKDITEKAGAKVFSSNFSLYRDISRRVFEVVRSEIDSIETYSIDECFFLLKESDLNKLQKLKVRVENEVGIPVSIGVANSKTQAKYVNQIAKRTKRVEVWGPDEWFNKIADIKLSEVWGVGGSHVRSFFKQGLQTVADFLTWPERLIKNSFGKFGESLYWELKGVSVLKVDNSDKSRKSIMSSRSLAVATDRYEVLRSEVLDHIHDVTNTLIDIKLLAGKLSIYAYPSRYSDYLMQGFSREVSFNFATNDLFTLAKEGVELLESGYRKGVPYQKIGVTISSLIPANYQSKSLFTEPENGKTQVLSDLIFLMNTKHKKSIELGRLSKGSREGIVSKKYLSPAYTTKWTDIKIVKT